MVVESDNLGSEARQRDGQIIVSRGLGAPLWVLLFAVLGSALFTVVLMIKEVGTRRDSSKDLLDSRQTSIREIVLHQLYILFAPLGGVFLYQILVLADAVTQPVSVAIAALGAGATLNILLAKAVGSAEAALKGVSGTTQSTPKE